MNGPNLVLYLACTPISNFLSVSSWKFVVSSFAISLKHQNLYEYNFTYSHKYTIGRGKHKLWSSVSFSSPFFLLYLRESVPLVTNRNIFHNVFGIIGDSRFFEADWYITHSQVYCVAKSASSCHLFTILAFLLSGMRLVVKLFQLSKLNLCSYLLISKEMFLRGDTLNLNVRLVLGILSNLYPF